jgi:DNA repair photolyase/primase-polymerase (primpol)-like protein
VAATIEPRQEQLNVLYHEIFGEEKRQQTRPHTNKSHVLSDDALILKATLAKNGTEFKALWDGSILGYNGDDSAADMALMNMLAFWTGGDAVQMERLFSRSNLGQRAKWWDRADYRERTIQKAISKAREFYEPPKDDNNGAASSHEKAAGLTSSEILEKVEADPRALRDPEILAGLAALKRGDPIEYDLLVDGIKKAHRGLRVDTIHALVDRYIQAHVKVAEKPTETHDDIKAKALAIAERGDPVKYLIWQAQRNHTGDIDYQKVLIASIASAASQTSNGIQPGGTGEKGSGKSDACTAVYHLVPPDRRLDGSLSPMSLFYLQETGRLKPGMILFSDDVEYEPIIPIYKRSTARFQHGITHFSVSGGKDRHGIELKIPPRIVWWLTSVEGVANEQAFDRQYPISTDSSPEHKKRVAHEISARRARKELRLADDEGIEFARELIEDIFANGPFKVLIPQAERAKWLKVSDFRGQEQFWDLVDALVILRWRQHERGSDGWLIAKDEDLIEAKGILARHKVAHFADLTEAEVKVVGAMSSGLPMTQKDLTEALGIAQSTLSERLRSIMAKSAIITEDHEGGKKVYTLNPQMQLGKEYWLNLDLIDIKTDISETYCRPQIALSGCYRYVIGIPIGIIINNSNRIPNSLSVDKQGSIEKGYPCDDCGKCPLREYHSILSPPKKADNDPNQQQEPLFDTDNLVDDRTDKTNNAISESTNVQIRQSSDAVVGADGVENQPALGPHPRRDEPTLKAIYRPGGSALEYAPFALNLHQGCSHNCEYCYARSLTRKSREQWKSDCNILTKKATLANIEADLKGWQGERKPVHLTFMGDPYDLGRQENSYTRTVLELFKKYHHPFQILSKGGMKAARDFDLYFEGCRFGCTLTFNNDKDSLEWEPGAALPADRIAALKAAHAKGIQTWVSLEPVIAPTQTLALIEMTHEFVDHYGVGKWNHDARADSIDWPKFRADGEELLKKFGKHYMIKDDLKKAAPCTDQHEPTPGGETVKRPFCYLAKLRTLAMMEYGMNGWVNPSKIAPKCGLLECQACRGLLHLGYVQYTRSDGSIAYRQKRTDEYQQPGRAEA